MPAQPRILTLDVGTSSVRASLHAATGDPVPGTLTQIAHGPRLLPGGGAELDGDALVDLVVQAIDGTLASAAASEDGPIAAVAASSMWHGVVGVDREGRTTTPLLIWADGRSRGEAAELRRRLDERTVHRRTGCVLHSSYLPAKLLWLRHTRPDAVAATARWLSPGELVALRLAGGGGVSVSTASATGLLDQRTLAWDSEVLAAAEVDPATLPEVSDDPSPGVTGSWRARWPALAGVPWYPALGDGACSNAGCGATTPERPALMVGTSGALRVLWEGEAVDPPEGLWCYRLDARRPLMGGALSDGGNDIAWLRRVLRLPEGAALDDAVAAVEPDGHGLTVLPLLAGERGPGWVEEARGAVAGLSLATTPEHLARATMEGIALRFALIAALLDGSVPAGRDVVATGGGMVHSPVWAQIVADALNRPVSVSPVAEASSRGAALVALERLGILESLAALPVPRGRRHDPDPARHAVYRAALERQRRLETALLG